MGLAAVCRTRRRTFGPLCRRESCPPADRSPPAVPWANTAWYPSQLHHQLWGASSDLSIRRFALPARTRAVRGEFQLFGVSVFSRRERQMKRIASLLLLCGALELPARAEIRSMDITIFGMD